MEGIDKKRLLEAFDKAGIFANETEASAQTDPITKADLYAYGLSGGADSKALRKKLQKQLGLPDLLSASALTEILNTMMTKQELAELTARLTDDSSKPASFDTTF